MHWGVCAGPEVAPAAVEAGLDYFEWTVSGYLQPLKELAEFEATLIQVTKTLLPCPVVNVFIPASLKITGPEWLQILPVP